ncbi:MAG: proton-conducting transporter membrane subunit [Deinococcales bacterium]
MGLFAWGLPLFPQAASALAPWLLALAAITAVYAGLLAIAQEDLKRLLAYASLSHMGIIAAGIFSLHITGLNGGVYLLAAQMASTSALFLLSGMLYERQKSFDLKAYGGMAKSAPLFAALSLFIIFASIGVPGLSNFPGEFLSLVGAFQQQPYLGALAALAVIVAGVYGVNLYQRLFQAEQKVALAEMGL